MSVIDASLDPRHLVAQGCRVLAHAGLADGVLGHISVRASANTMYIRCRGPRERGLLFTVPDDVHEVDFHGNGELPDGYVPPNEVHLHGQILLARPDVRTVAHAHPMSAVIASLADLTLEPAFGAFNIPAMRLGLAGVPTFGKESLISTADLGRQVADILGERQACILRGHGIVACGTSVEEAVVTSLDLDCLARIAVSTRTLGAAPAPISADVVAALPRLGTELNVASVWRLRTALLDHEGLALE